MSVQKPTIRKDKKYTQGTTPKQRVCETPVCDGGGNGATVDRSNSRNTATH